MQYFMKSEKKILRNGFTTGSCAAAAAKAATYMLLTGKVKNSISIDTPKGIRFDAIIYNIVRLEQMVSCSVIKDGGDDIDVTTGAHIFATVKFIEGDSYVRIEGGKGVGIVTKPGLDQEVGEAAINSVPRKMITNEVLQVMKICDYTGGLSVEISVPDGETIAKETFNERLGIVGGISILGTSGIVEPMSFEAIKGTISAELSQRHALGFDYVSITPGNYGLDYMKRTYDFDLDKSVKCSNFIGDTIDMAVEFGFKGMLLTGHIGKLVKVAGGMMNTHSKYGDNRMDVLSDCAKKVLGDERLYEKIHDCAVTEDAIDLLEDLNIKNEAMEIMMADIMNNLNARKNETNNDLRIECMVYSNKHGLLAKSCGAMEMLELCKLK